MQELVEVMQKNNARGILPSLSTYQVLERYSSEDREAIETMTNKECRAVEFRKYLCSIRPEQSEKKVVVVSHGAFGCALTRPPGMRSPEDKSAGLQLTNL